tara:strand:+ start:547 stop:1698 length:1152 start_codon:yes stop_codon:yes gene_type:complete
MNENTFGQDLEFLNRHVETVVLSNSEGASAIVVPAYQGRTMTSTSSGMAGASYGYLNYEAIAAGNRDPQINLYGGEDRMWISPEGGQYSVFFDPDAEMLYENWRTPACLDTEPFRLTGHDQSSASFERVAKLTNWSQFEFDLKMERTVKLLETASAATHLACSLEGLSVAAHESSNRLSNIGDSPWESETGLIGIWMLCMNKPAAGATLLVPFKVGSESELGPIVNADYFGKLDQSRLQIDETGGLLYFLGDGKLRSKLGLTYKRVEPYLGSWDRDRGILSVVQFNLPDTAPNGYNNNLWEIQEDPYCGDVINGYNDGPNESGGQLGGFFELETISPALALETGGSYTHLHRTIRMEGDRQALSRVSVEVFGVDLDEIEHRFE